MDRVLRDESQLARKGCFDTDRRRIPVSSCLEHQTPGRGVVVYALQRAADTIDLLDRRAWVCFHARPAEPGIVRNLATRNARHQRASVVQTVPDVLASTARRAPGCCAIRVFTQRHHELSQRRQMALQRIDEGRFVAGSSDRFDGSGGCAHTATLRRRPGSGS